MAVMWLMMVIIVLAMVAAVGSLSTRRQLPPPSGSQDALLAQQAERIDQLEEELRRLKEQADFTEKLLLERGTIQGDDKLLADEESQ